MVGADGLGDPARLVVDHVRLSDRVQERRLAVIHVTHDGYNRRPGLQILRRILGSLQGLVTLILRRLHLVAKIGGDQRGGIAIDRLVDGHHEAQADQLVDHLGRLDAHPLGHFSDTDHLVHADPPLDRLRRGDQGLLHLDRRGLLFFTPFRRPFLPFDVDLPTLPVDQSLDEGLFARRRFAHQYLNGRFSTLLPRSLRFRLPVGLFRARRNPFPDILDDLQIRSAGEFFSTPRRRDRRFRRRLLGSPLFRGRALDFAGWRGLDG